MCSSTERLVLKSQVYFQGNFITNLKSFIRKTPELILIINIYEQTIFFNARGINKSQSAPGPGLAFRCYINCIFWHGAAPDCLNFYSIFPVVVNATAIHREPYNILLWTITISWSGFNFLFGYYVSGRNFFPPNFSKDLWIRLNLDYLIIQSHKTSRSPPQDRLNRSICDIFCRALITVLCEHIDVMNWRLSQSSRQKNHAPALGRICNTQIIRKHVTQFLINTIRMSYKYSLCDWPTKACWMFVKNMEWGFFVNSYAFFSKCVYFSRVRR